MTMSLRPALRRGVTLLELLIVIMIVGLLTTAALKAYDTSLQAGRFAATRRTLEELASALVGNPELVTHGARVDFGYVGDLGMLPDTKLSDLVSPPAGIDTGLWRGPYIINRVAENPTGYQRDAWGDSLIYEPSLLSISSMRGVSYLMRDSWITRKLARNQNDLLNNKVQGWVKDAKGNPPDSASPFLSVSIAYPRMGRFYSETVATATIENGYFEFLPTVPIGKHPVTVRWIDTFTPVDTTWVQKTATVTPGGKTFLDVHLPIPFR
jgi:prepilin-type N-terminal cleavage/methylation domain-containing protein